ncbi:MAG: glycosyltransferase family 2 protein [Phycisphaerales bacterium]|jgi:hypothetical protein|nr:glycosyltransferase family 2 protein [Phycisphaerales bacterium]
MGAELSIAIVCKNNADTIGKVLASIKGLAGEVVAVDSGSTDGTIEMLKAAGARVVHSAWLGHVKTKQLALESCRQEWALCLDSDEPVMPDLRGSIEGLLAENPARVVGARVNRKVWYCPGERGGTNGRFLEHAWQPEWRLRLVRRARARWTGLDPHDKLEVDTTGGGKIIDLAGTLRHDSFSTFAEQLAKEAQYARMMGQSLFDNGRRGSAWRAITSPPGAFLKQMVLKQAWRDGTPGWLAAFSTAASTLMKHVVLLELTARERGASQGAPDEGDSAANPSGFGAASGPDAGDGAGDAATAR